MAKIRFFISYFLILSLTVIFVWGACGGGDSDSDGDDVVIVECDGATSGSFADDGGQFELTIPDSGVSDCLYISPNVTSSSDTTDLVGENETLLSGSAFELSLNTEGDNDAEASPDEDLLITIAFDESLVPDAGDVDALHIYANVAFEDEDGNEVVVPVFGDVDDGELIINTKGLYNVTRWVVVYNPDMGSDIDTTEPTVYLTDASQLTDEPGYSGGWNQNDWCAMYDASDAVLRQTIATALSKAVGELTGADISTYIKTNVSLAAKIAGLTYADGGFREPNLYPYEPSSSPSQVNICSDATRDYYKVIIAGSSHYQNPSTVKGKNPFGILYLGSSEVNDAITGAAGSTFDAIAHEMFHAIFAGYDLSFLRRGLGMNEGMASTLGHTLGWADYFDRVSINSTDWDYITAPYVRTANDTEIFLLSNQLNTLKKTRSEAYSNQDFYAFVANYANGGRLDYLDSVLDSVYTNLSAIATTSMTTIVGYDLVLGYMLSQINTALSAGLSGVLSQDLPTLYSAFVVDRAYDHSSASQLRTGDPTSASISTSLFAADAMTAESVDPEDIDEDYSKTGSFANVPAYTSRLLTITSSQNVVTGRKLSIDVSDAAGAVSAGSGSSSEGIRVFMRGDESTAFSSGMATVSDFGASDNTIYIIIANTTTSTLTINYEFTAGASNAPSLTVSGCPVTMDINTSVPIDFGYADGDGNITTLWETVTLAGESVTASGDVSTYMTGTSGTYSTYIEYTGDNDESQTLVYTFWIVDADGNSSNTETCTTELLPNI